MEINSIFKNKFNEIFEVVKDTGFQEKMKIYIVRFLETNNYQYAASNLISRLGIRDISKPVYYGVGFVKAINNKPVDIKIQSFEIWKKMIGQCYSGKIKMYENVSVCEEWHNYCNFREWYDNNYLKGFDLCLNKALFTMDNKICSPETCCFLPKELNDYIQMHKLNNGGLTGNMSTGTVMELLQLMKKYSPKLDKHVFNVLSCNCKSSIRKFNPKERIELTTRFHDITDKEKVSDIELTAFIKYNGMLFEFFTIGEIEEFISNIKEMVSLKDEYIICSHLQ